VSFADDTIDELLDQLAAPAPSPCGGATAAITAAMASALVEMVASGSHDWAEGERVAARASELRARLLELAWRDTQAVAGLVRLGRLPATERSDALEQAVRVPDEIDEAARETAVLAALAETAGKHTMRADATAARLLAEAAARVAEQIRAVNAAG